MQLQQKKEFTDQKVIISDYEPNEAAEILLAYKPSEELNEGKLSKFRTIC
jgi:hypothetical protein